MTTKVTEEGLRHLVNQVFEILDANKNGTLEENEVRDWFSAMIKNHQPGREFDEQRFSANWKKMDTDTNNCVDKEELFRFMLSKA